VGPVQHPGSPTTLFQLRKISFLGHTMYGGPLFHLLMDLGEDVAAGAITPALAAEKMRALL